MTALIAAFGLAVVMLALFVLLAVALIVAVQAGWRGYPVWAWTLAGLLGNPVFLLVVLGALPDFARRKLREEYLREIEGKLRERVKRLPPSSATAAVPRPDAIERSLGDMPTNLPERSLGDEETRA